MKEIRRLYGAFLAFTLFLLGGCVDNEPFYETFPGDQVAFRYYVKGDYQLDYLVGSVITFENLSTESGAYTWDFGDGSAQVHEQSPSHKYAVAGTYNVSLEIAGVGKLFKKILISDIFPTIKMDPISGGVCEVNNTSIHFSVNLPNPENLSVEYTWMLPSGTINANGDEITEYKGENPGKLKFKNIGSQKIVLKTLLGGRPLQDGVMNVQVGYTSDVKTLYYAVKGGNIMALKLITSVPSGMLNKPFDLGIKSGQHPMNIIFSDTLLYVFDPGKQFTYINDQDGVLGDGSIFAVSKDGGRVETILTNKNAAFDDPFYGFIDDKNIYFSDRNTGICRIPKDSRNLSMNRTDSRFAYFVENQRLLYYKVAYDYGAINACMTRLSDGTWWWAKTYSGIGIFRFKESDIQSSNVAAGVVDKPYPVLAGGLFIKSFVVDEIRMIVYYVIRDKGLYKASVDDFNKISSSNLGTLIQGFTSDSDGSAGEYIDVCQLALDPDDGSVYFGYRKDPTSTMLSGLKRYDLNQNKVVSVIDNVDIYGVTINHTKSKLF